MKIGDEELRAIYRGGTARPAGDRGGCPSGEEMAAALSGGSGRERIALHAAGCSDCAGELRSLVPLSALVARTLEGEARGEGRLLFWRRPAVRTGLRLLAAAVLVVSAGLSLQLLRPAEPATDAPPVFRGKALPLSGMTPPDGAVLTAPPDELSWAAVATADGYRVALQDAEATPLWTGPLVREPRVALPAEVRARLGRGRFFWRVSALEGVRELPSPLMRFTVSPP